MVENLNMLITSYASELLESLNEMFLVINSSMSAMKKWQQNLLSKSPVFKWLMLFAILWNVKYSNRLFYLKSSYATLTEGYSLTL